MNHYIIILSGWHGLFGGFWIADMDGWPIGSSVDDLAGSVRPFEEFLTWSLISSLWLALMTQCFFSFFFRLALCSFSIQQLFPRTGYVSFCCSPTGVEIQIFAGQNTNLAPSSHRACQMFSVSWSFLSPFSPRFGLVHLYAEAHDTGIVPFPCFLFVWWMAILVLLRASQRVTFLVVS